MRFHLPEMPPALLLASLERYNLLPAIVFLPTRRRCDQAASEAALARRGNVSVKHEARRDVIRSFAQEHPEVRGHRHWETIIKGGVAAHHAGHVPAWKLVIERLMSAGLLDAIFATTTVAAGVDFPARTVVISNVDARTGSGWRQLSASEVQQMTGRAGRRGRDRVGFVVAAPGPFQDPQRLATMLTASPDPLQSQFRATYSTLLNLLDAYGSFARVREIAERSFAHRAASRRIHAYEQEQIEAERRIVEKIERAGCDAKVDAARGLERLASARARLHEALPQTRAEMLAKWLDETVVPGRIVGIGRSGRRYVLVTRRSGGNVTGIREDGRPATFALERIGRVYELRYPLDPGSIDAAFADVRARGGELQLAEPRLRESHRDEDEAVKILDGLIERVAGRAREPGGPGHMEDGSSAKCAEALWSVMEHAEGYERAQARIQLIRAEVWEPFARRARVLDHFGYLDYAAELVTARGKWLADLHVDRPLLVGEAVEKGLFASLDPELATALVAALAADGDRDYGELGLEDRVISTLAEFDEIAYHVATEEWNRGIDPAEEINFSAAATAALWAKGAEWPRLVQETRAEEGDLVRMLSRTGESLLQIAGLRKAQPAAAEIAARAAELVLREPVR